MKDRFLRDGFIVVQGFLHSDEVAEVVENAERCIRELDHGAHTLAHYHDEARPESLYYFRPRDDDPFFLPFRQGPRMKEIAVEILGEAVETGPLSWMDKPPGYDDPTLPHQDIYYDMLLPPCAVMCWLALDEAVEENACLRFVRGSHERGPAAARAQPRLPLQARDQRLWPGRLRSGDSGAGSSGGSDRTRLPDDPPRRHQPLG